MRQPEDTLTGDLAGLMAEARQADQADAGTAPAGEGGAVEGEAAAPSGMTNAQAVAFGLETFRALAGGLLKVESLSHTLNDQAIGAMAESLGAVADKYGVDLGGLAGGYAVELKAAFVCVPIVYAAWDGMSKELAARRREAAKVEGPKPEAVATAAPPAAAPVRNESGSLAAMGSLSEG